jgi:hypothetical protein
LEGLPTVMFALRLDVSDYIWQLGLAYGEGAVTILPGEGTSAKRFVDPKTGSAF